MEITATDTHGLSTSKKLTFIVTNIIEVYVNTFPSDIDPAYASTVREAFGYWEKRDNIIFKEVSSIGHDTVVIDWVKEYSDTHIGQAFRDTANIGLGELPLLTASNALSLNISNTKYYLW